MWKEMEIPSFSTGVLTAIVFIGGVMAVGKVVAHSIQVDAQSAVTEESVAI